MLGDVIPVAADNSEEDTMVRYVVSKQKRSRRLPATLGQLRLMDCPSSPTSTCGFDILGEMFHCLTIHLLVFGHRELLSITSFAERALQAQS